MTFSGIARYLGRPSASIHAIREMAFYIFGLLANSRKANQDLVQAAEIIIHDPEVRLLSPQVNLMKDSIGRANGISVSFGHVQRMHFDIYREGDTSFILGIKFSARYLYQRVAVTVSRLDNTVRDLLGQMKQTKEFQQILQHPSPTLPDIVHRIEASA